MTLLTSLERCNKKKFLLARTHCVVLNSALGALGSTPPITMQRLGNVILPACGDSKSSPRPCRLAWWAEPQEILNEFYRSRPACRITACACGRRLLYPYAHSSPSHPPRVSGRRPDGGSPNRHRENRRVYFAAAGKTQPQRPTRRQAPRARSNSNAHP